MILDLPGLFDRCYDEGAFDRRIDYRREPVPPLGHADSEWADAQPRGRNLRG